MNTATSAKAQPLAAPASEEALLPEVGQYNAAVAYGGGGHTRGCDSACRSSKRRMGLRRHHRRKRQ